MNRKMITEYLKTIVFAVLASVGISMLLCHVLFFQERESDKNTLQYWVQEIDRYIDYTHEFVVDEEALQMLKKYNSWIQILDKEGAVEYSRYVPDIFYQGLSDLKLLNNHLMSENISGYTLYAMELPGYPGFSVLIGCDSEVARKNPITLEDDEDVLFLKCALVFLGIMLVVITYAAFHYSRKIAAPVSKVLQNIEYISEGKSVEVENKENLFQSVFLKLQKLQNRLQENESMRNVWISNVSHDIKTPLSTIKGYAELLNSGEMELDKEEVKSFAAEILKSEESIEGLVSDLSISHRLAEGKMSLKKSEISLKEVLSEAVAMARGHYHETAKITVKCEEDVRLFCDKQLLVRSVMNIICNAFIHNDRDVHVEVAAVVVGEDVTITITDDGKGMSEKELEHIFERYYRGTNSENAQGSGLGLAIAKEVLEAHGGGIKAQVLPQGGMQFVLTMKNRIVTTQNDKTEEQAFMKKKLVVGSVIAIIVVMILGTLLFWAYRNPPVSMKLNDRLQPIQMVMIGTYAFLPMPFDILEGITEWQDTLAGQYAAYSKEYSEFEVDYKTEIKENSTIIYLSGEGLSKKSGQLEKISDTIILDYKLYH